MLGPFVRSGERIVAAEQLMLGGARVAAGLDSLGIGAGDGVAIYLRNDLAFFEAALGAASSAPTRSRSTGTTTRRRGAIRASRTPGRRRS